MDKASGKKGLPHLVRQPRVHYEIFIQISFR